MDKNRAIRYLTSQIREQIFKIHNYQCQECGSNKKLEIHHIHYDFFDEKALNLLCHKCHNKKHSSFICVGLHQMEEDDLRLKLLSSER